jgi:Fe-S cluster biogenesis protein NfuA
MTERSQEEIERDIQECIIERIQPVVESDGGMIVYHGFENGVVSVSMMGACHGCSSSEITLKHGIENMLKYFVPEVEEVVAI